MYIITDRYKELDWQKDGFEKPWLGHKFGKESKMAHDFRCPICGKWISYNDEQINDFIAEGRWDFEKNRLAHCGNSTCQDYYHECQLDLERKGKMACWELYRELKSKAFVL